MIPILFIQLSVLCSLCVANPQKRPSKSKEPFDVSKSGEYAVVGCGSANAANVVDLLETLWSALLPAIQDAESATPSRAYQTFFKNVEYASYVSNVLANVSTGASLYPPTKFTNGAPVLTCVTAAGQFKYKITTTGQEEDAYTECLRKPTEVAKSMSGTSFIILCPNFFTSPSMPAKPPPNNCLTVNTYINRFQGFQKDRTGAEMVQYQLWVLLEEILHYYIFRTSSQWETLTIADIYDANQCLRLSAKDSTENPHNYLYYVAMAGVLTTMAGVSTRPSGTVFPPVPSGNALAALLSSTGNRTDPAGYTPEITDVDFGD
ncbi:hypothetical protein MMC28_000527 [Mycoblastus sanguinarius]|nr:hypothetical protein [Mycoblastus sanguinarius]